MPLPRAITTLIGEFSRLPGVGKRGAERMVFDLVSASPERLESLIGSLRSVLEEVELCPTCGFFISNGECGLCCGRSRDCGSILVVESPQEVLAVENAGGYRGLYHVLGGHLSPLKGVGPGDLRMDTLSQRLANEEVQELILATSPTVEGDATALYIAREYHRDGLTITRLGRGVPMGGS
ncbi:MAG: recombination protein RecR, partial [Candidatus Sumerlaeia bacterium]|nr:recombination protein RecR [Candidatus Sumerlaeia bacterium]